MKADRIIVLDAGRIVGSGHPHRAARDQRDLPRDRLLPALRSGGRGMSGRPGGGAPSRSGPAAVACGWVPGGRPPMRRGDGRTGRNDGRDAAEKSKNFKVAFGRLLARLRPEAPLIVLVFILAIVSVTFAVIGPKILGNATNVIFQGAIRQGAAGRRHPGPGRGRPARLGQRPARRHARRDDPDPGRRASTSGPWPGSCSS